MQFIFKGLSWLFVSFILWLIYQRNTGVNLDIVNAVASIPNGDKWAHFLLFGTLTFITILASNYRRMTHPTFNKFYVASLVIASVVLLEEVSQLFVTTRTFEWMDLFANACGIIGFSLLASWIESARDDTKDTKESEKP